MRGGGSRRFGLAACAALGFWGAGCSDGGEGVADAGPGGGGYPDADTAPCRYGADQPGARAVYQTRLDAIQSSAVYVVDLGDPSRACAVHEGRNYPDVRWLRNGDGLIIEGDGFVYWIDISGGLAREPQFVGRGQIRSVSPSSRWLTFTRFHFDAPTTQYIAAIGPEGVGEPMAVSDSWTHLRWWAPNADVALVQDTATGQLIWLRLGEEGIAEQRTLAELEGGKLNATLWSPDGSKVAVHVTESDGPTRILLVEASAPDQVHELPVPDELAGQPVWAPDSQRLAYSVGALGTYVVDVSTLPPAPDATIQLSGEWSVWSGPTSLAHNTGLTLTVTSLTGDDALTAFEVADLIGSASSMHIQVSPDGHRAVHGGSEEPEFVNQYSELTVPPTAPVDLGLNTYPFGVWAPDSETMLLWRGKPFSELDEPTELALVSFSGAEPSARELTWDGYLDHLRFEVTWAPDSSSVVLLDDRNVGAHRLDPSTAEVKALDVPRPPGSFLLDWMWAPVSGGGR